MKLSSVDGVAAIAPAPVSRWGCFDALRALAAFGVILIHIGITCNYQVAPSVVRLQNLCAGVVPFFLVTAFYFAARREMKGDSPWKAFWAARASRLLVPFLFWGLLYTALRALLYLKAGQTAELSALERDPIALIFNGGAIALYFLPILFAGLIELRLLAPWLRRAPLASLFCCCLALLGVQWRLEVTGNIFTAGTGHAFQPWTTYLDSLNAFPDFNAFAVSRVLLVFLSHFLRCAPLICFAFLVARSDSAASPGPIKWPLALVCGVYLLLFAAASSSAPASLFWLFPADIAGMSVFLIALSVKEKVPSTALTTTLGAYSFGIYLVHQVVLTVFRLSLGNHLPTPVGAPLALVLALATFSISYFLTAVAARSGRFGRRVFAVEGG